MFELFAGILIILFGLTQILMMLAAAFFYPKVRAWKNKLQTSRSMLAKLELIIFF